MSKLTRIRFSSTAVCLGFTLLAGCSTFEAKPPPVETPSDVAVDCPVCPSPETRDLQCPQPEVVERVVTVTPPVPVAVSDPKPTTAGDKHLPIVGAVEWATVEPGDLRLEARIDTGAETSAIHAENIQLVEKDGKRWVQFTLLDPATDEEVAVERRLRKKLRIKQSDKESEVRYVVELWITIGKIRSLVEVTLSDRDRMDHPLLIGRNMLVDTMIVDVSHRHTSKPPKSK